MKKKTEKAEEAEKAEKVNLMLEGVVVEKAEKAEKSENADLGLGHRFFLPYFKNMVIRKYYHIKIW